MAHFVFPSTFLVLAVTLLQASLFGQPLASGQAAKDHDAAPSQRLLTGDDAKQVEEFERKVAELNAAGSYAEAQVPARAIVAIRTRRQGTTHWQTLTAKSTLETLERITTLPADAQAE